jgi:glycosyltransferase involved in cell wall biosynthesis
MDRHLGAAVAWPAVRTVYRHLIALEAHKAALDGDVGKLRQVFRDIRRHAHLGAMQRELFYLTAAAASRRENKVLKSAKRLMQFDFLSSREYRLIVGATAETGSMLDFAEAATRWARNVPKAARGNPDVDRFFRTSGNRSHLLNSRGPAHSDQRVFVQEALLDHIASRYVPRTDFISGSILHVTGALGPGGAERQFVNTVSTLMQAFRTGRLERPPLAAVLRHGRGPSTDFFMPALRQTGAKVFSCQSIAIPEHHALRARHLPQSAEAFALLELLPKRQSQIALELYYLLVCVKPEVVHFWQDETNITGAFAALLAGVPQVHLFTRSTRPVKFTRHRRYLRGCYRKLLRQANVKLVNNSEAGRTDYAKWLGVDAEIITTIRNGIDLRSFSEANTPAQRAQLRAFLGLPEQATVVGGVMRMSEEKQPGLWLDVALLLAERKPDVYFVCVGDGPLLQPVRERAKSSAYAHRLLFPGSARPIAPWFGIMNLLLSTSATEGLPNVAIEAQSQGVPVIATDAGGTRETIVPGMTGEICAIDDVDALVAACERGLSDESWRARASRLAVENCLAKFDVTVMRNALLELYGFDDRLERQPVRGVI